MGGLRQQLCAALTTIIFMLIGGTAGSEEMTKLSGNHPAETTSLSLPASRNMILQIKVTLAPRDRDALDKLLSELQDRTSPLYHHWLSSREFENRFGQPRARVADVRRWLSSKGLHVTQVSTGEILASGTVAQAERAFSVAIVTSSDRSYYANKSDPIIPARFARVISSIQGLDDLGQAIPYVIVRALTGQHFKPSDLQAFYNETPLLNADIDGRSLATPRPGPRNPSECGIALIEKSDYLDAAVDLFNTTYSLPALLPGYQGIRRVFPNANPGRTGAENEALLDIEWAHAVAPGAFIWVYISSDLSSAINKAVSDSRCGTISISYGLCGYTSSFYQNLDALFMRAASQGQSVFVSSGDFGAAAEISSGPGSRCSPGASRGVSEMAASPNVTSVGGTEFTPNFDASGNDVGSVSESAWKDASGATGGGQSGIFAKPAYQVGVTPDDGVRDVPDIALGASAGEPGFYVYLDQNGQPTRFSAGGTSIATPMWAGVARLISQKASFPRHNSHAPNCRLGNMNQEIYQLRAAADALRDVTTGDNSFNGVPGFSAGPGYDQATGWGTLDMTNFVNAYTADVCAICR